MHPELVRKLSKPSKVASLFDWKKANNGTVLVLNFHKNRIGIAIGYHPSTVQSSTGGGGGAPASCYELEPLRFDNNNKNHNNNNSNGTCTINSARALSIASRGAINQSCLDRFSDIIETYKVCGVIVSWPIQHDTGRMGAACGRVIYALEQLWEQSNGGNNSNNDNSNSNNYNHNNHNNDDNDNNGINGGSRGLLSRPFCLWDAGHIDLKQRTDPSRRVDAFGRCASYGGSSSSSDSTSTSAKDSSDDHSILASSSSSSSTSSSTSTVPESNNSNNNSNTRNSKYFAGKEQYHEDELTVVVGIWNDFCKEHWPTLTLSPPTAISTKALTNFQVQEQQQQRQETQHINKSNNNNNNNNNSNDTKNNHPENNDQESSLGYDGKFIKVNDVFLLIVVCCLRVTLNKQLNKTNRNGSRYVIYRRTS